MLAGATLNAAQPWLGAMYNSPKNQAKRLMKAGFSKNAMFMGLNNTGNVQGFQNIDIPANIVEEQALLKAQTAATEAGTRGQTITNDLNQLQLDWQSDSSNDPAGTSNIASQLTAGLSTALKGPALAQSQTELNQSRVPVAKQDIIESEARVEDIASQMAKRSEETELIKIQQARESIGLSTDFEKLAQAEFQTEIIQIQSQFEALNQITDVAQKITKIDEINANIALLNIRAGIGSIQKDEAQIVLDKAKATKTWVKYRAAIKSASDAGVAPAQGLEIIIAGSEYLADLFGGIFSASATSTTPR